jgi:hypothetical protein
MQRQKSPLNSSPTSTASLLNVSPESITSLPIPKLGGMQHAAVPMFLESAGGDFSVTPATLDFRDVEPGVEYRLSVTIKNRLSRPQRVRALQSALSITSTKPAATGAVPFTVHYTGSSAAIAPGMTVTVDVIFSVPGSIARKLSPLERMSAAESNNSALSLGEAAADLAAANVLVEQHYHDVIVIKSEAGGEVRLSVHASAPGPNIILGDDDSDELAFGPITAGSIATRLLVVRNTSTIRGALISSTMTLPPKATPLPMRVRPQQMLLAAAPMPGQPLGKRSNAVTLRVLIDARTLPTGSYRALLELDLGPSSGHAKRLVDITADVVEQVISLIVPDVTELSGSRALTAGSKREGQSPRIGAILSAAEPLHMGTFFTGQTQTVHAQVINNGPNPVSFSLATGTLARAILGEANGISNTSRRTATHGGGVGKFADVVQSARKFADVLVSATMDDEDDESKPKNAILLAAADKDFIVTPSVGKLLPYGSMPIVITYTAVDRRKASSFSTKSRQSATLLNAPASPVRSPFSGPPTRRSESPLSISDSYDGDYNDARLDSPVKLSSTFDSDKPTTTSDIFSSVLALTCTELGQRMGVKLFAKLVRPEASVSTNVIDFGKMAYAAPRRSATLRLSSQTELLPMVWRAGKCTGFHVSPESGILRPQESVEITIIFKPTHLGPAHEVLPLSFSPLNSTGISMKHATSSEPLMSGSIENALNIADADTQSILTLPIAVMAFVVPSADHEKDSARLPNGTLDLSIAPPVVTSSDFRRTSDITRSALEVGPAIIHLGEGGVAGSSENVATAIAVAGGGVLNLTKVQAVSMVSARRDSEAPGHGSSRAAEHSNRISLRALEATAKAIALGPSQHPQGKNTVAAVTTLAAMTSAIVRAGVFTSTALLETTAHRGLALTDVPGDNALYSFTVMRAHARQVHAARYNAFLLDQFAIRKRERSIADLTRRGLLVQWNDTTSLGINDGKLGLKPPHLRMPESSDPLWLVRTVKATGSVTIREKEARKMLNPDKVFASKFKLTPTTHAERIDATRQLTPDELASVICGPPTIDIGETLIKHPFKKTWGVINGLSTSVLITLELPSDAYELSQSGPLSQLVPPNGHAGFIITFLKKETTSEKNGLDTNFKAEVSYTINGKYTSRFTVLATCIPARVQANKTLTQLFFTDDNLSPYVSDTVRLTNSSAVSLKSLSRQ